MRNLTIVIAAIFTVFNICSLYSAESIATSPIASVDVRSDRSSLNARQLTTTHNQYVVNIYSEPKAGAPQDGSGLLTSIDGAPYVLTCAHVINCPGDQARLRVTLADGKRAGFKRVCVDFKLDLAAIELELLKGSLKLPDFWSALAEVVEGDKLVFYACSGKERTPVKGYMQVEQTNVFDHDSPYNDMIKVRGSEIAKGFSGGPVLNKEKKLAGLVVKMDAQDRCVGEIVPASEIVKFVRLFTETNSSWTPSLSGFYTHNDAQNVVASVITHTTAETIGLRKGDEIVKVNGIEAKDRATILHETARRDLADINLVVLRNGQELVLSTANAEGYALSETTERVADDLLQGPGVHPAQVYLGL